MVVSHRKSRGLNYEVLDVFTKDPLKGNPLAVVMLEASNALTQQQKLDITGEFNLSETVFLYSIDYDRAVWGADIFTVGAEIPWAGHPTIGSASVISTKYNALLEATLVTKAGRLKLSYAQADDNIFECVVPIKYHLHKQALSQHEIQLLQPAALTSSTAASPIFSIANGMSFALIKTSSQGDLVRLQRASAQSPKDFVQLDDGWDNTLVGAYFYTIQSITESHCVLTARMFLGLIEDPATGSAASALASFLALHHADLQRLDRVTFAIHQGETMGRPSTIQVCVTKEGGTIRQVNLSGSCVTTMSGALYV